MYKIILLLTNLLLANSFLIPNFQTRYNNKLYEKMNPQNDYFDKENTNIWDQVSQNLKLKARKWFISRAEKKGIKWYDFLEKYKDMETVKTLVSNKMLIENKDIIYPDYFLKPFHGYDTGNMNWFAAMEGEGSTESVSVNYWKDVNPKDSQNWFRYNFTQSVDKYIDGNPNIILDIGSSFGLGTRFLKKTFPSSYITCIDLSPYFLATAKYLDTLDYHDFDFIHANAENIPFQNNSVDLITAQFLFHEVPTEPSLNILNEAYRVLKPGGSLAIIDLDPNRLLEGLNNNFFRKWAFEVTEPHISEYYHTDMIENMKTAEFQNIEKIINDPINTVWLGKKI